MKLSTTMKRIILLLGVIVSLAACLNIANAQNSEGVILYEVRTNLHRRIPKEREQMKAMVPEFRTEKVQLFFNANESNYKSVEEDSEEQMASAPPTGGGMQIRMQTPKVDLYLDNSSQQRVAIQEFMGKEYLVTDTLQIAPWKFGTETKTILGYECKQAYYTDESRPDQKQEITAWYTDKIRPFLGPERFHSLPGTILAVDVNNAERVLSAKQIDLRPLKKNELKKPTKGTPISQAEFRKTVEEQMKKMNNGQGGILIRN
jgi:GLPGLI family protein